MKLQIPAVRWREFLVAASELKEGFAVKRIGERIITHTHDGLWFPILCFLVEPDDAKAGDLRQYELLAIDDSWCMIDVLRHTYHVISRHGYLSTTKADMGSGPKSSTKRLVQTSLETSDVDYPVVDNQIKRLLAWIIDLEPGDNEYLCNLQAAMLCGVVTNRTLGLVVSAPGAYERWLEEQDEAGYPPSEWLSYVTLEVQPGERVDLSLTIVGVREFEGKFGWSSLIRARAEDGALCVWFESGFSLGYARGSKVEGSATVKKLDIYEGVKQTALTRCVWG